MFDAYHKWLGIPPEEQPPDHYRLLGIGRLESDPEVIAAAADRQMAYLRTFQSGPQAEACQRLLNEVARARVCLLDPARKAAYDARLRAATTGGASAQLRGMDEAAEGGAQRAPLRLPWLPRPTAPTRAPARRQSAALRRLVTVASAAIAALACAWLFGRYVGVFHAKQTAWQAVPAGRTGVPAKAPAVPPVAPLHDTKPIVSPDRSAGTTGNTPPSKPLPTESPVAAAPPQTKPLPNVPLRTPKPWFPPPTPDPDEPDEVAPARTDKPAGSEPWPAPRASPAPPQGDPRIAPAASPQPKVSALAPPGTVAAKPAKPEGLSAARSRETAELFENALSLVAQGRYPVAYQKLHEILKADRNRFDVLFALGLLEAVVAHEWDDAEKHFSQCAKLEPKSVPVLNNLALVRLRTNKAGLAFRHWEAVLDAALPPPDEVVQNIARTCLLVRNRRLILSPENLRALDLLARKVDAAARAKQGAMFYYLLPDGEPARGFRWPNPPGLTEDWCTFCLGYGKVKCPSCVRGAVRSPATRVLAADRDSGTVVTQTGTVRSRCTRCKGTGWVDCQACADGHQR